MTSPTYCIRCAWLIVLTLSLWPTLATTQEVDAPVTDWYCNFAPENGGYRGSAVEQVRCLLRAFGRYGNLSDSSRPIPTFLESIVGKTSRITKRSLRDYLAGQRDRDGRIVRPEIAEADIGGSLDQELVRSKSQWDGKQASYFVIHDTSTPEENNLPEDRDRLSWSFNNVHDARIYTDWWRIVNVMVGRTGSSRTFTDFATTRADYEFFLSSEDFKKVGQRFLRAAVTMECLSTIPVFELSTSEAPSFMSKMFNPVPLILI